MGLFIKRFSRLKWVERGLNRKIKKLIASSGLFDEAFYLSHHPQLAEIRLDPLDHFLSSDGRWRSPHPLFDAAWYLRQNPEVNASGANPLVHYLQTGWKQSCSPCPLFDIDFYLSANRIVLTDRDPLSHYLQSEDAITQDPHPLFNARFYKSQAFEENSEERNPLLDYVTRGWQKGYKPHLLLDVNFYLEQNPDVRDADVEPFQHYLVHGWKEGRDPHALFDSDWYWTQKQDETPTWQNPVLHYLISGWKQKRSPCAFFDEAFYQSQYPDVPRAKLAGLSDYLTSGAGQGRNPNRWFDTRWYTAQNPDVSQRRVNPLVHYVSEGAREGKRTRPLAERSQRLRRNGTRNRVIFVSGEPGTPGHRYRVVHLARSLPPKTFQTAIISASEIPQMLCDITDADLVWVWRAGLSPETQLLIAAHNQKRFALVYDVDDLMFRPALATAEEIDGIRSQNMSEKRVKRHYEAIRLLLMEADRCTAPTAHLASEMRQFDRPATVIPNGFDRSTWKRARQAVRERKLTPSDGFTRIGYAGGSLTHQRDLAEASCALAAILRENPNTKLVLFRGKVNIDEFPEWEDVRHQIEWRDFVSLDELPFEYARFDINIAPLEIGNRFCESKSELKYFEAALAGVPTIASSTQAFATAIRHGENGFLANDTDDWYEYLDRLVKDSALRARLADAAYMCSLWQYGPERRTVLTTRLAQQLLAPAPLRHEVFRSEMLGADNSCVPAPVVPAYNVIFESTNQAGSRVSVVVPVFNYAHYVEEALDSLLQQTLHDIDIIVVDDRSTDNSLEVARKWLERYASRFHKVALLQNKRNSNLGRTRNAGVHFSDTEMYLPLDADNALLPDCLELCLRALDETGAAFAYPTIMTFGDRQDLLGIYEYDPARFQCRNFIDAMALVRKAAWVAVGGYTPLQPVGWEDYEFWCKLAEKGLFGVRVPETSARYRTHRQSMLRTFTDRPDVQPLAVAEMNGRHPWLKLRVWDSEPATVRSDDALPNAAAENRNG